MTWNEADHPRDERGKFTLKEIADHWQAEGVKLDVFPTRAGYLELSRIVVPPDKRGQGLGSKVMAELLDYADAQGTTIALTPDGSYGGSVTRLKEFYKRFGFVENKGRNRDFEISPSFYRLPTLKKSISDEMERKHPGGQWITMHGHHVYIKADGQMADETAPEGMKGGSAPHMDAADQYGWDYNTMRKLVDFAQGQLRRSGYTGDDLTDVDELALIIENDYTMYKNYIADVDTDEYDLSVAIQAFLDGKIARPTHGGKAQTKTFSGQYEGGAESPQADTGSDRWQARQDAIPDGDLPNLYALANQRKTKSNSDELTQARSMIVSAYNADPDRVAKALGLSRGEMTKKMKSWGALPKEGQEKQARINTGVPEEYQWVGMSNLSSWIAEGAKEEDLTQYVASVTNHKGGWEGQIAARDALRTFLALDTRLNYSDLHIEIKSLREQRCYGNYRDYEKRITLDNTAINTLSHEVGHYIDHKWGGKQALSEYYPPKQGESYEQWAERLAPVYRQDFEGRNDLGRWKFKARRFMQEIREGASNQSEYLAQDNETFARFVERFVEWTHRSAGMRAYQSHFTDYFTDDQFTRFARMLQERAALDAKYGHGEGDQ